MRLKWRTAGDNTTAIPVLAGRSASQLEMRKRGGSLAFGHLVLMTYSALLCIADWAWTILQIQPKAVIERLRTQEQMEAALKIYNAVTEMKSSVNTLYTALKTTRETQQTFNKITMEDSDPRTIDRASKIFEGIKSMQTAGSQLAEDLQRVQLLALNQALETVHDAWDHGMITHDEVL
jgi:hypothetical protein